MTDKVYWFVAAVFREIDELTATLVKLRAQNVVASHTHIFTSNLLN